MAAVKAGVGVFRHLSGLKHRRGRLTAGVAVRLAVLSLVLLSGCGRKAPPPAPPPPKVAVVTVQAQAVPITTELPGRISAYRTADVRPQVNGIILKRLFVEGSEVKAGQQLYQIDPAPFQAALRQRRRGAGFRPGARGTLQAGGRSECSQQAGLRQRRRPRTCRPQGRGGNGAHQPGYTRVMAPISGRIGRSLDHRRRAGHRRTKRRARHRAAARPESTWMSRSRARRCCASTRGGRGSSRESRRARPKRGTCWRTAPTTAAPASCNFPTSRWTKARASVTLRACFPIPNASCCRACSCASDPGGRRQGACSAPQQGVSHDRTARPTALVVGRTTRSSCGHRDRPAIGDKWLVTRGSKPATASSSRACSRRSPAPRCSPRSTGRRDDEDGAVGPPTGRPRRTRAPRHGRLLHRPADLRLGHRHRHHAGRRRCRSSTLPIAQYPSIAPPAIVDHRHLSRAPRPRRVEDTVTQVIEQQMTGIDHLLYISSDQRRRRAA